MLGGLAECLRGDFESFGLAEFGVFVFDVDRHFGATRVSDPASGFLHSTCLRASTGLDDLAVQLVGDNHADRV